MRGCLFFVGFFSKHAVFTQVLVGRGPVIFPVIMVLGRVMTCLYSVRLASSLLKLGKVTVVRPIQLTLVICCLLGGRWVSKVLSFERGFTPWACGFLSFLFVV